MHIHQPRRRWESFPPDVQELRRVSVAWFEALLRREVTPYNGSDSILYPPNSSSRFKLLPYDDAEGFPHRLGGEGLLVGLDLAKCSAAFGNRLESEFPDVPWLREPFTVQVGSGTHDYRWAQIAANQAWDRRRLILWRLGQVVRRLEDSVVYV